MNIDKQPPELELKKAYVWIATWFGSGFLKPAPGTWGSVCAIPVGIILFQALGLYAFCMSILITFCIGYWSSNLFEKRTGIHDSKMIVIDEVVGQWIALLPCLHYIGLSPLLIFIAFILFRLFDITKPWPISHFDKNVGGAWGVMLDDVLAGLAAAICLLGLIYAGLS